MKVFKSFLKATVCVAALVGIMFAGTKEVKAAPNPDYFYFKLSSGTASLQITRDYDKFQYSKDGGNSWYDVPSGGDLSGFFSSATDKCVYIRRKPGEDVGAIGADYTTTAFFDTGSAGGGELEVGGDILSLLSYDESQEMYSNTFKCLFLNCVNVKSASDLILPNYVKDYSYYRMFEGCASLEKAPALPAESLNRSCYCSMFEGCTSLEEAPALPAKSLNSGCYESMFKGCSRLNEIHVKFTNWDVNVAGFWVDGVSATGKFYGPASLEESYDSSHIPAGWTFIKESPAPDPAPKPAPKPASSGDEEIGYNLYDFLKYFKVEKEEKPVVKEVVDKDTYKSSVPSKTVMALDASGKMDMDMKVHPSSKQSETNQKFLVNYNAEQMGKVPTIILTSDIFMRNDLLNARYGQTDKLVWNNLNYKIPGSVYAVVYNETDGAYLISGTIDANGNATFEGFILRPASTITIFAAN